MSVGVLRYRGPRHLDRTLALEVGDVDPAGLRLQFDVRPTIDGGLEALLAGECDVAEIPLGVLLAFRARRDHRVVGVPVFLSRRFPHRFLWVARDSDLHRPADLDGRTVGWAPGAGAAAAWSRHLLTGAGAAPEYVPGAMGGSMAAVLDLGREPAGETLPEAVIGGQLDALATPYPVPPEEGGDRLRPLIADRGAAEREWVAEGGFLPMSTVLALAGSPAESTDLAPALIEAFEAARQAGLERLRYPGAPAVGLPWLGDHLLELDELFPSGSPYRHGMTENLPALQAFTHQAHALGITPVELRPEELF